MFDGLFDGGLHLILKADIHGQRQRVAARRFHLRRRRVDGARQSGMRSIGFRCDYNICAIARRAQRNRQADAAAGA